MEARADLVFKVSPGSRTEVSLTTQLPQAPADVLLFLCEEGAASALAENVEMQSAGSHDRYEGLSGVGAYVEESFSPLNSVIPVLDGPVPTIFSLLFQSDDRNVPNLGEATLEAFEGVIAKVGPPNTLLVIAYASSVLDIAGEGLAAFFQGNARRIEDAYEGKEPPRISLYMVSDVDVEIESDLIEIVASRLSGFPDTFKETRPDVKTAEQSAPSEEEPQREPELEAPPETPPTQQVSSEGAPEQRPPERRETKAPGFLPDRPVEDRSGDDLGRTAVADAIAKSVREVWKDHESSPRPFAVHLAGRWGSGKSSVLWFLRESLKSGRAMIDGKERDVDKWLVVEFNAWRRQDEGTPWWALMNAVISASEKQLPFYDRRAVVRGDRRWRWLNGQGYEWWPALAIITTICLFYLFVEVTSPSGTGPDDTFTKTETYTTTSSGQSYQATDDSEAIISGADLTTKVEVSVTEEKVETNLLISVWNDAKTFIPVLVAFFGTIASIYGILKRLNRRQADTAEALMQLDLDPTQPLHDRFEQVIKDVNRPVAIFVDDLDRCNAAYLVDLLETFQTIYADVPVLYVVAADRDWIVSAYGQVYKDFAGDVSKPGQPLGHLFVEKIFQLSVTLPDLGSADRDQLLDALLGDAEPEPQAAAEPFLVQIAESGGDIGRLSAIVRSAKAAGAGPRVGQAAFTALQSEEGQTEIRHILRDYVDVMDPNPRALKRLVNDYTYRQGFLFLAGEDVPSQPLIHWSILNQRFPYAAAEIAADASLLTKSAREAWEVEAAAAKRPHLPFFENGDIDTLTAGISKDNLEKLTTLG